MARAQGVPTLNIQVKDELLGWLRQKAESEHRTIRAQLELILRQAKLDDEYEPEVVRRQMAGAMQHARERGDA